MTRSRTLACGVRRNFGAIAAKRNPNFGILNDKDVSYFESILDKGSVITDEEIIKPHNSDWTKKFVGDSKLMLKPKTNEQVSAILKYCNDQKLAVVPQGGRTGLVGGS